MEFIKSWTMVIAGTIVIGAICEMLMPDGNIKKYVRIVLGLLLVFAMIEPIGDFSEKDLFSVEMKQQKNVMLSSDYDIEDRQRTDIIRVYKRNLEKKMEEGLPSKYEGYKIEIKTEVETEKEDSFGNITGVHVLIYDNPENLELEGMSRDIKEYLKKEFDVNNELIAVKEIIENTSL